MTTATRNVLTEAAVRAIAESVPSMLVGERRFFVLDDGTLVDTSGDLVDRGRICRHTIRALHDSDD